MAAIVSWKDLQAWQKAHELVLFTYQATKAFPTDEKFGLSSQMRRAAVSVTSNIVEGFKRWTAKDSLNFYNKSAASLEELRYQYLLARELEYLDQESFTKAEAQAESTAKLLHAWTVSQRQNSRQR